MEGTRLGKILGERSAYNDREIFIAVCNNVGTSVGPEFEVTEVSRK